MQTLRQIHEHILTTNTASLHADIHEQKLAASSGKAISIYFLNNFTINAIEPILKTYLHASKLASKLVFGNYDNVKQDILDDYSPLYQEKFDIVVSSLMYFPTDPHFLRRLDDIPLFIDELKSSFDLLREKTSSLILINTLLSPFVPLENIAPLSHKATHVEAITEVNQFIRAYCREHRNRCYLMDWVRYTQILGEQNSIDYRYKYLYKSPFKKSFLSYYASDISCIARALHGYAKKCLILDCDNTLWGGVIGEDGLSGIKLNNDEYPGKAFYDFQYSLLALKERGIILTLCSKNNEADVWDVLENHPHSLLKRKDFAATRINWENKAANIIDMIRELNISLDSCVFVDDSSTECGWVKNAIPEMTVVQVPKSLYEYPTLLLTHGIFETLAVNEEDKQRNELYQQEAARKKILTQVKDIDTFLTTLELKAYIHFLQDQEIPRVAQLTQKTNQFNLSTHRYSHQQIEAFANASDTAAFSLTVADKFGNYGLTGVLIARKLQNKGFIDSFLLSCRILSRNLEFVFVEYCLQKLSEAWGVTVWETEYIPTEKNSQVKDFLLKAGFTHKQNNLYVLDMNHWELKKINYINVMTEEHKCLKFA